MTKKTESNTPILDDEDNHSSHHYIRALWLQRQPDWEEGCLLYTSPSPRDGLLSRMPSSA